MGSGLSCWDCQPAGASPNCIPYPGLHPLNPQDLSQTLTSSWKKIKGSPPPNKWVSKHQKELQPTIRC